MAEEVLTTEQTEEQQQPAVVQNDFSNKMQQAMWGEPPVEEKQPEGSEQKQEAIAPPAEEKKIEEPKPEEEIIDEDAFVKRYFEGFENVESVKKEIETLRAKSQTPAEIKFENEISGKLFQAIQAGKVKEVTKILAEQERLEEITAKEVNKDTSEEIIKLGMSLKYGDLTASEINYKYQKEFGLPKEPVQRDTETEEEFEERKAEWEQKVSDIETHRIIEAKLLRPELENAKSKIVFPEVGQNNNAAGPSQEELDAFKKMQDSFVQSAKTNIDSFKGFSVQVKDKDVDYSVNYAPSAEEKAKVTAIINQFAQDGFNPNALLAERWVTQDGSLDVERITKDLMRIYAGDKAEQKIATDAANQRLELYLKERKNINLDNTQRGTAMPEGKSHSERLQEAFWG